MGIGGVSIGYRWPDGSLTFRRPRSRSSLFPHGAKSPTFLSPLWYRQTAGTAVGRGRGRSPTQSPSAGSAAGIGRSGGVGLLRWALAHAAPRRPHHLPLPPITCSSHHLWLPTLSRLGAAARPRSIFLASGKPGAAFPDPSSVLWSDSDQNLFFHLFLVGPLGVAPGAGFEGSKRMR